MPTLNQLLAQAAGTAPTAQAPQTGGPLLSPEQAYSIAAGTGTEHGAQSMPEVEFDLRTLTPNQLISKYGQENAYQLMGNQQFGDTAFQQDLTRAANRSGNEAAWDSLTGVGSGFVGSFAGLGALGLGLIDEDAGTWAGQKVQQGTQWVEEHQSDAVNAARRAQRAVSALDMRDNAAQREAEIETGDSELVAGLRRWGRDTVDTFSNSITDPTMLAQGTAEAGGSLLAGGPISKGLKAIGGMAVKSAGAARLVNRAAWPLTTAGLEAGGAYSQTVNDIQNMSYEELEASSPTYRELVANGATPEEARTEIANKSGLMAAAIQAPVAGLTGTLTRFAERPFHVPSIGSALTNTFVKEPLEEAIQSSTGQLAQNVAQRQFANENLDLSEGVGEQTAQGALYGATSAGVVQAPGVAVQAPVAAAKLIYRGAKTAFGGTVGGILERGAERRRDLEKASPVADEAIQERAAANVQTLPETMPAVREAIQSTEGSQEEKVQAEEYVSTLEQAAVYDSTSPEFDILPEDQKALLEGSVSRPEAIQRMAREVARLDGDPNQLRAAAGLWTLMEPFYNLQEADPTTIDSVAMANPQIDDMLKQYESVVAEIESTPSVQRALRSISEMVAKDQTSANIQPVTEESLDTVEGKQNVNNALAVAALHPDRGNLEANEQILAHAARGKLNLTPIQMASLKASTDLLRARQEYEAQVSKNGLSAAKDVVSSQIVAGNDPLRKQAKSALQHTMEIVSAMRGKNTDLASLRLEDFGKFVQHMQNKVQALNQHFAEGTNRKEDAVHYEALQASEDPNNRIFKESRDGMWVNARSPKSVDQAQSIALEARLLSNIYNGLTQAFPELGQGEIQAIPLDPQLDGKPDEVVQRLKTPTPVQQQQETKTDGQEVNTEEVQSTGTTEGEAERVDSGTEAEPEESRPRPELIEETPEVIEAPAGVDREIRDGTVRLVESQTGPVSTIEAYVDGTKVGELNYSLDGSLEQEVKVEDGFKRRGIATAMYDLARERGATLAPASRQSEEGQAFNAPVQEVQEEAPQPTGIEGAFPNLFQGVKNFFLDSFVFPKEAKTRLYAEESPRDSLRRALSSNMRLQSFLSGSTLRNTLTSELADAYQELLSDSTEGNTLGHLLSSVTKNLTSFLNRAYSKKDSTTIGEHLTKGMEANRWKNGKVLNLLDNVDGKFQYNQQLLEQAGLAAMQWYLVHNQYETNMDEQDVSDMTGIPVGSLAAFDGLIEQLTQGMSKEQVIFTMAQKIKNYWGLDSKATADRAYTDGIPQSVAAEMVRGLVDMGLMKIERIQLSPEVHGIPEAKTLDRYVPTPLVVDEEGTPHLITEFPDAIEVAVMVNPERPSYFGDERPDVAQRQMNNPEIENTADQKQAIKQEQETPFYINRPMVNFFTSLGPDNLLRLFGTNISEETDWNINHLKTLEGQNTSITAAYNQMISTVNELTNVSDTLGQEIDQVPVRYGYNMSRVGRMQMLGKYNPQASKLMREAFLPTRTTLDLSNQNSEHWAAYTLGLAQAMGIKVHNMPVADAQAELSDMLNGGLNSALQTIQGWLNQTDLDNPLDADVTFTSEEVEELRAAFKEAGADLTMASLHALVDFALLQNTSDRSSYTTSVYLEADGVTNGPINAMALMSIGQFNQEWIDNIRKGGLTIGPARSLADIRTQDSKDLYQASTDATRGRLAQLRNQLGEQQNASEATGQMNQLLSMMDLFIPDISFDSETGALEMKRGIAKNPLTITVYGSGARGIANKFVNQLATEIYSRFSQVVQARKANPNITLPEAMFPNDPDAQIKMDRFQAAYNALTRQKPFRRKGELRFEEVGQRRTSFNPQTFTFDKSELEAMQENMLHLFVEPMRQGIEDTVGHSLLEAVGLIRDAAQIQSIVLENQFLHAIDAKLAEKEANDSNWKRGDFLSQTEIQGIQKSLQNIAPLVQTGEQAFMINSSQRLEVRGNDLNIAAALDDTLETGPSIYAPGQAGVRAIPTLTIGMGDGMMMQLLAKLGLQGTLKIFDGMNMPLDKITEQSRAANEAVYESWKGNPLREMLGSFDSFVTNWDDGFVNDQSYDALTRVLFTPQERREAGETKFTAAEILERVNHIQWNLKWAADSIDARHEALQSVPLSVDQMAAAAAPFHNGRTGLEEATPEEILAALNDRYTKIMQGEPTEEVSVAPVVHVAPAKPTPEVEKVGRVHRTGARVLSWTAMTNLGRMGAMTEAQKLIFDEIRRSLSARDYKVITGTIEQLDAYIAEKGLQERPNQEVFGWTNIGDQTIYMVNPTMETLVHELVHASSYETVLAHYRGETSPQVTDAIQRLETMMEDFLALGEETMDPAFRSAYNSARQAIEDASTDLETDTAVARAKALNEFMAWAMTNEQLTKTLKQKPASKLVQLAKNVIKAIKNLVWGRKIAPKPVDDFLSNLQFNSGIIIRSQPSISTINRDGQLFHSAAYGTNNRLTEVRQAFGKKIVDYLADEKFTRKDKLRQVRVSDAQLSAIDVALGMNAHGFPMTMQESGTFRMIVTALATEAEIDPNALARAQELYTHVAKNLTVEHFMADPESLDPAMRYYAQEKYDSVMGKHLTRKDDKGRSSLLPAFLGLAVVNDEFRSVLSQLGLPARTKNQEGTLDAWLENTSNTVMDSLSHRLAGDTSSRNVQEAVDNLIRHIREVAQNEQTFLDQYASKPGGLSDRVNDYLVTSVGRLSDIAMEKADKIEQTSKNTLVRAGARITRLAAAMASEKNGAIVAEQTMVMLNKSNLWEPIHKLMADLVGRTQSNKLIYDMIKVVRSSVQQVRQQFREETPRIIMSKFKGTMTDAQWGTMFRAMGKTDLAVLRDAMTHADIHKLFTDQTSLDNEINKLEQLIQTNDPKHWGLIKKKSQQLATFMNTGVPGPVLLRNAEAIGALYGHTVSKGYKNPPANIIKAIDRLTTLYAIEGLPQEDRTSMASLVQGEANGLSFTLDYLVGQRKEEMSKAAKGKARINAYKGFIPSEQQQGSSLIVSDDRNFAELRERGYIRVADYKGSSTERRVSPRGYYHSPLSGRAVFNQGIMQNVRHTAGGVDAVSGFTVGATAGRITDRHVVRRLAAQMRNETNNEEALMPVWNEYGQVIALERPVSAVQQQRVQPSQHLPKMIGVWRGRQAEEGMSQVYNEKLIDAMKATYDEDMKVSSSNRKQYINLLDSKSLTAVQQDAVNLFTDQTLDHVHQVFGEGEFWVRKDLLDDAIGYRSASVTDFWTGNTKWSKDTQEAVRNLVAGFSIDGYKYLLKSEQTIQNFMADARTLIVVKSVVVPTLNFMSNIYQLIARGVPILSIARSMPKKLGEIDSYAKSRLREIDAEAELRATEDPIQQRKLKAELQSIQDAHKRLSIWPLIQAGEFSTIADVGMTHEDLELTSGKLVQYMERQVNKLPEGVRNAGRYALITKDTALFQGLQKSVQYGDFIAKAVLYDDLTKRQKKSAEEAMGRITEEFVNYDRLPGRFRSYMENMGLLWFYNYKIRISKVALSMIRNNPFHALTASMLPAPVDGIDLPMGDNIIVKMIENSLGFSVGPGMALRAPMLNPWFNLVD